MIRRTPLLVAAIALAAAGCSRSEPTAPYGGQVSQPAYQSNVPVYAPSTYPQSYPQQVAAPQPTRVYRQTVQSRPQPVYRAPVPSSPRQVYRQPAPAEARQAAPLNVQVVAAAPDAVPANRTLIAPRPYAQQPQAPSAFELANSGTPRATSIPVDKPAVYSPFPRRKPSAPANAGPSVRAAAAAPRASTLSIAGPSYTASTGGATPPIIEYHIPHLPQEEPLWCWAAAAQQAIGWVNNGRAPAQCAIVAMAHGISVEDCCGDKDGICARTGEIPAIAALVRRFGGQAAETASVPRDPKEVYSILQGGGTLLIRLRPAPHDQAAGIRHMIVVRGLEWLRLPNGQLSATLHYNDPLGAGQRSVDFNEIVGFFEQALIVRRST